KIADWTGGSGDEPASDKYIGPSGLVDTALEATDIRGPTGATGATGEKGDTGAAGADGEDGWTPEFAIVSDDERRVVQIVDWAGGTGTKPATGDYIGASGLVSDIAEAIDIRGATGETGQAGP